MEVHLNNDNNLPGIKWRRGMVWEPPTRREVLRTRTYTSFYPESSANPGKVTVLEKLNGEHHGVADHTDVSAILDFPDDHSDRNDAWPVRQEAGLQVLIGLRAGA